AATRERAWRKARSGSGCATMTLRMQVLQAGPHKFIYLELEQETIATIAKQAGFDMKAKESERLLQLDLTASSRESPLLLFDAADPANLGWFSRCQFYVDGRN